MNSKRRKRLMEAIGMIEAAEAIVEEVRDDEEETYDNMSERLQMSPYGTRMEDDVDNLDEAANDLDTVIGTIREVLEG